MINHQILWQLHAITLFSDSDKHICAWLGVQPALPWGWVVPFVQNSAVFRWACHPLFVLKMGDDRVSTGKTSRHHLGLLEKKSKNEGFRGWSSAPALVPWSLGTMLWHVLFSSKMLHCKRRRNMQKWEVVSFSLSVADTMLMNTMQMRRLYFQHIVN